MKKIALITGASSGIGKELSYIHAEKGGDLILVARSEDKLIEIKKDIEKEHGVKVELIIKDLTKESAPKEIYDEVSKRGYSIEYLINNAGFGGVGKFHERDWSSDLSMIKLNVIALAALTRLFLPDLVSKNKGRILNVSSTASLMPGPLQAVYFATKAFVTSFSNAVNEELSDTKVTVTTLMPGATETDFAKTAKMEDTDLFKNTFSARSVAEEGYEGMVAGKLDVIAGVSFSQKIMMKGIPFAPKKIVMSQVKKMQQ